MEISKRFEVVIPIQTIKKKFIKNVELFLKNKIQVTLVTNNSQLKKKNRYLKIIEIKANNIAKKRNIGISKSKAQYIILIDSDIVPNRNYLKNLNKITRLNKKDVLSGPNIHDQDGSILNKLISNSYKAFLIQGPNNFIKKKFIGEKKINFAQSCNLIINRKTFLKKKIFFNENLFTGEDISLCRNLFKKKINIYFSGKLWVLHQTKNFKNYIFERLTYGKSFYKLIENRAYSTAFNLFIVFLYFLMNIFFYYNLFLFDLNKFFLLIPVLPHFIDVFINNRSKYIILQSVFNFFVSFLPALGMILPILVRQSFYKNNSD